MSKSPIDPLRVRLIDLVEALNDRLVNVRDYGSVPGNAWLAKGEIVQMSQITSELESLLEDIKEADAENGFD